MSRAKNSALPGTEHVLHTKLMPPRLRSSTIQRQDLMERLDSGLHGKLILVSAPTGFGKTTLVSILGGSKQPTTDPIALFDLTEAT